MKTKIYTLLLFIVASFTACIEPFDITAETDISRLVVDARITDEPGVKTVRLFYTVTSDAEATGKFPPLRNATVVISDDKGNTATLAEMLPGTYQTTAIQGIVGNTYTLTITTPEGKEYKSSPELMAATPAMDKLYWEVKRKQYINENGNVAYLPPVLQVFVDTKDPANEKNYYQWKWQGVYQVKTQPEDYKVLVGPNWVSRPKDCCEDCWVTDDKTTTLNVQDDRLINGQEVKRKLVAEVPMNEFTFGIRHYIEIHQFSLSEGAYDYWRTLKTQISTGSDVQAPPPATVVGNVVNINDPKEKVLGYFGASAVSKSSFFITQYDAGVYFPTLVYPDDCRVIPNSTAERPLYW
ncbi:DUF4249 domain-containing protein [Pontibacter sp. KCTC 32443]|uniref:DUF4249 domain-containing protein n=1 Tax=Pontibacter TaxID=323449 RepID=UPI00164DFAF2|nr:MULTISPECIES: DUF4249 domain-containing protein [Pontibacter]MBC5775844.1 DUF4249 domain-containing protein [Pontibacter sp. KCTC 32443]